MPVGYSSKTAKTHSLPGLERLRADKARYCIVLVH